MKYISIKDPTYNNHLNVYTNCPFAAVEKDLQRELKDDKLTIPRASADGKFLLLENNNRHWYVLWVGKFDWTIADQALLSHEVLHYIFESLRQSGIEYCSQSEEAFTYYYQRTYADILKALLKQYPQKARKAKA